MKYAFALIDCNNFYASCERVLQPQLHGRPIIILSNNDGCIVALSQEAKALGLSVGVPLFKCRQLFHQHQIHIFSSNYALYGDMSRRVMSILSHFTDAMEVYSIDEAFLHMDKHDDLETQGQTIRQTLNQWLGLPVSIGFGPTKTLAKLANKIAKKYHRKDGVFNLLDPSANKDILDRLAVQEIWGIGPAYSALLHQHGIHSIYQFIQASPAWVKKHLSLVGLRILWELRGIPCLALDQIPQPKKTICRSRSFGQSIHTLEDLMEALAAYTATAAYQLRQQKHLATSLQIHLETNRFKDHYYTNSITIPLTAPTASTSELVRYAHQGLNHIYRPGYYYRRTGIILTGLLSPAQQPLSIFPQKNHYSSQQQALMHAVDQLNQRFGRGSVRWAGEGLKQNWQMRQSRRSPRYTTRWQEVLQIKLFNKHVVPNTRQQSPLPEGTTVLP